MPMAHFIFKRMTGNYSLYKSDGTITGTVKVKSSIYSPNGSKMVHVGNGNIFFIIGNELWTSNGTNAGTYSVYTFTYNIVKILSKNSSNQVYVYTEGNIFNGNGTVTYIPEFWQSDGTNGGTTKLFDMPSYVNVEFVELNGTFYFLGYASATGKDLWKTDGTLAGTSIAYDFPTTVVNGLYTVQLPNELKRFNNSLLIRSEKFESYLYGSANNLSSSVWTSNGTTAGTTELKEFVYNYITPIEVAGSSAYFTVDDSTNGRELWKTDGTSGGTVLVKDVDPGESSSYPNKMKSVGNTLFFEAFSGIKYTGIWKTDGTNIGTVNVKNLNNLSVVGGSGGDHVSSNIPFFYFNNKLNFASGRFWNIDPASNQLGITAQLPIFSSAFPETKIISGSIFYKGSDGELYRADGTVAGNYKVKDIRAGTNSPDINSLTVLNNLIIFNANDGTNSQELWRSDGTEVGTYLLKDIYSGTTSSNPRNFKIFNGALYFVADEGFNYGALYKTDGTTTGTVVVKYFDNGGFFNTEASVFLEFNNQLYFNPSTQSEGRELWKTDGTTAGTVMVKDIVSGSGSSNSSPQIVWNGSLYFTASNQLWKTDGTTAGTVKISPDDYFGGFFFTPFNNLLYFMAEGSNAGRELWKTDGTAAGTTLAVDVLLGINGSSPQDLMVYNNNTLIFSAMGKLWKTDGTQAGTAEISPNLINPQRTTIFNNTILTLVGGNLYRSNGTAAGTQNLTAGLPTYSSSNNNDITLFTVFGSYVYFVKNYSDIWRVDISPPCANPPSQPTASGVTISNGSTASLSANCTSGTAKWYDQTTSSNLLQTGANFTTPALYVSTTYYVACESASNCTSERTSVLVTILPPPPAQPANFTTSTNAICQGTTGVVYTVPNVSGVTYNWTYSGTAVTINGSGNSVMIDFANNATSGTLSLTATNSAGTSPTRSLAITVNAFSASAPTALGLTINAGTTASLTATGCSTYNWYNQISGGTLLQSAATSSFTTPTLYNNTTYYVACASGTCESSRTSVLVTVTGGSSAILVAHYPFCGNANDVTSNINNGTVNGATLISDRFGNANSAYNFDGNDFISTPNLATSNADNWAMTAWVKPNSISQIMGTIMHNGFDNGSTGNGYGMLMADGGSGTGNTLTGLFSGVSFYNSGGIFSTNNIWYHITMTRISGVTKFYINGEQTSNTSTTMPSSPVGNLIIGSMNGIRFWNGGIDDVKVYSSGLTTSEVQTIYINESVNNAPTITASSNSPRCVGNTINFTASGGNTYIWNGPNTFTATGSTPLIANVTAVATGTYIVIGANSFGCTNTATTSVTISTSGTPTANGVTITSGNTASITATGCTTYKWYDLSTGGSLLFTGNPFISPALTTNTTYHVACSDAPCPETSRIAVLVTVNGVGVPPQPGAIVGSNVACQGRLGLAYLVTAVAGATSYTWTYSGTGITFVGGISNTRTITLDFSYSATSGTMSVTANNANGSSPASTMAITVSPAPSAPTASGVTIASGNTANLTATGCAIYKWYSQAIGGTVTYTGQNFITPILTSTTNYYVACNPGTSCESPRVLVTVTVPCTQMISVKTGAWNDPTVWSCNRIPTATDNITIETGHIVTIPAGTFSVKNVTDKGTLNYALNGILQIFGGS